MALKPRSEKGLLTPENCVIVLIDYQPEMFFGVTSIDRQMLINNVVGFAKSAKIFDVPLILSTVESKQFSGEMLPQLKAIYPDQVPLERTSMDVWDDEPAVAAIKKTDKKKLVLGGLWTEVCVAFLAIQALHDGYEVYVVEDICGDLDLRVHETAMRRVEQAGAKPVTWIQVLLEWQRDWANADTYAATMDVIKTHGGGYGVGVEFANTMVNKKAPTVYPSWTVPTT